MVRVIPLSSTALIVHRGEWIDINHVTIRPAQGRGKLDVLREMSRRRRVLITDDVDMAGFGERCRTGFSAKRNTRFPGCPCVSSPMF